MTTTAYVLAPDTAQRQWIESALHSLADQVVFIATAAWLLERPATGEGAGAGDCLVACAEPDESEALQLVRELRRRGSKLPAIVLGPHTAFRTAVEIARLEATDFLERPVSARQLRAAVRKVCRTGR